MVESTAPLSCVRCATIKTYFEIVTGRSGHVKDFQRCSTRYSDLHLKMALTFRITLTLFHGILRACNNAQVSRALLTASIAVGVESTFIS
eukprot:5759415-Amphidinium_carterae.1